MSCTYPKCNCPIDAPTCALGLNKTRKDSAMTASTEKEVLPKIDFTPANYSLIAKGKRTTIRLGDKNYELGGVVFTVGTSTSEYTPIITEIRKLRFSRLTLQDALDDGYNSLNALREELQSCYGKFISDREIVTIVRFEV